jgi:hypothetical protein
VDDAPASVALPTNLAQPAFPILFPTIFQVSEVFFERTPKTAGDSNNNPFVEAPATHALPEVVICPTRVPVVASSGEAGRAPENTQMHPVVNMLFKLPVLNNMVFAPVLRPIFAMLIFASSKDNGVSRLK